MKRRCDTCEWGEAVKEKPGRIRCHNARHIAADSLACIASQEVPENIWLQLSNWWCSEWKSRQPLTCGACYWCDPYKFHSDPPAGKGYCNSIGGVELLGGVTTNGMVTLCSGACKYFIHKDDPC